MRKIVKFLSVGVASLMLAGLVIAQDSKPDAKAKDKPAAAAPAEKGKGRLPAYYGKLELSETQREKIRATVAKYDAEIDAIEKQLADVKAKRDKDIEAELTPAQKETLAKLNTEAEAKRKSAKKKPAEKKPAEK